MDQHHELDTGNILTAWVKEEGVKSNIRQQEMSKFYCPTCKEYNYYRFALVLWLKSGDLNRINSATLWEIMSLNLKVVQIPNKNWMFSWDIKSPPWYNTFSLYQKISYSWLPLKITRISQNTEYFLMIFSITNIKRVYKAKNSWRPPLREIKLSPLC